MAGQAASGPPYWGEFPFDVRGLARGRLGEAEIVGPVPARDGQAGWFLMQEPLHGGGSIALHVRLASLTELLGAPSLAGVLQPILRTPVGDFDVVGRPAAIHGKVIDGAELVPGWKPALVVDPEELLRPFQTARFGLLVAALVAAAAVGWVSARLARRLQHRVQLLADGAERLSAGEFTYRVPDAGTRRDRARWRSPSTPWRRGSASSSSGRSAWSGSRRSASFSTGVAHEVRNPLATLKTTVQALERARADPQRATLLRDMGREIDRMARTLGEILAFGRPRPPQRSDGPGAGGRAAAARRSSRRRREARQVDFTVQGDPNVTAVADPDHLQQIPMNLALNALQATPRRRPRHPARPPRRATAWRSRSRDTGSGIAEERLARSSSRSSRRSRAAPGSGSASRACSPS